MLASVPLTDLQAGQEGQIFSISKDEHKLKKLMALGVYPGLLIRLMQKFPAYVFQIGFTQVAVDHEIAKEIMVIL